MQYFLNIKIIFIENILRLVEFDLNLPGTSALGKTLFSLVKILLFPKKSQRKVSTISNILTVNLYKIILQIS